jgi:hypothetical protein
MTSALATVFFAVIGFFTPDSAVTNFARFVTFILIGFMALLLALAVLSPRDM